MIATKTALLFYLINYASGLIDRIAGGKKVFKGQFPFFVQLHIGTNSDGLGFQCGGSLIFPRWILTAAHCFSGSSGSINTLAKRGWILAVMGTEESFGSDGEYNRINRVILHPLFIIEYSDKQEGRVKRLENDIALALLESPYTMNRYISLITLPEKTFWSTRCLNGTVVGAGKTSFSSRLSKYVLYAEVQSTSLRYLSSPVMVRGGSTVFYTEIEWYKGHPLKGDSGGPYVCYEDNVAVQYGICSAGYNSTVHKHTIVNIYESVEDHLDFIFAYASKAESLKVAVLENFLIVLSSVYLVCYKINNLYVCKLV